MKFKYRLMLVLAIFIGWPILNPMAAEEHILPDYYFLSVEAVNIHATVTLNGAPLVVHKDGTGLTVDKPVTTWLMPGKNKLEVNLNPLPNEPSIRGSIKVSIFLHDPSSDSPTPSKVYADVLYPTGDVDENSAAFSKKVEFNFTDEVITNLWRDAKTLTGISDGDKKIIFDIVENLRNSLLSKDTSEATNLQIYKIQEDALAENKDFKKIISVTNSTYQWLSQQKGLTSNTVSLEDIRLKLLADNKVVYVSKANGDNVLQLESDDLFFEIPIYMAKINGEWKLVR